MAAKKNILFIMCDQLRYDYLGCTGHKTIKTPNIDALAARGVNFINTTCQSPVCGPSRASTYTGRYMSNHGATANFTPLRVSEKNIGDYLNPLGVRTVLTGKTHVIPDREGFERLGIDPEGPVANHLAQGGFEVVERDDGIHPDHMVKPDLPYNEYLRSKGYGEFKNPWHWAANSVDTDAHGIRSGYFNDSVDRAARVTDEDSETPYMTRRAMEFMDQDDGEKPWLLHLSYIKPHWPYVAPAPYHDMYTADDVQPAIRADHELDNPNDVAQVMLSRVASQTFRSQEAREKVIPAYMGLITQIDDQLGLLLDFMDKKGLLDDTMIVFTSDHGDYLGDHWMGDKEYFHKASVNVPLIIADPSPEADVTRGTVCEAQVELIDMIPTFMDFHGGKIPHHILDGLSVMPLIHGKPVKWREFSISEYDYSCQVHRHDTGREGLDCRIYMIADKDWKLIYAPGSPHVLFDLNNDPDELINLAQDPAHAGTVMTMFTKLAEWSLQYRQRVTWTEEKVDQMTGIEEKMGVIIGFWDEDSAAGKDPSILPNREKDRV